MFIAYQSTDVHCKYSNVVVMVYSVRIGRHVNERACQLSALVHRTPLTFTDAHELSAKEETSNHCDDVVKKA